MPLPVEHGADLSSVASAPCAPSADAAQPVCARPSDAAPLTLDEIEIETIRKALDAANGNISVASKRLGISRNTIYRKLRWSRPE
jgi:transcriptional regulator of acetoin/glycerol metabolism